MRAARCRLGVDVGGTHTDRLAVEASVFYSLMSCLGPHLHFNDGVRDIVRLKFGRTCEKGLRRMVRRCSRRSHACSSRRSSLPKR
jgi:hypothetical protein